MLKVDNWLITTACLAVSALLYPGYSNADAYLCEAQHASGYVYDRETETWDPSTLPTEDRKYLVSSADTSNVFIKALKYDYQIRKIDAAQPMIHCKSVKLNESNEETGLVTCKGSYGASFSFDKRSGRYIHSQPAGYVALDSAPETGKGPYLEIGNCSPK